MYVALAHVEERAAYTISRRTYTPKSHLSPIPFERKKKTISSQLQLWFVYLHTTSYIRVWVPHTLFIRSLQYIGADAASRAITKIRRRRLGFRIVVYYKHIWYITYMWVGAQDFWWHTEFDSSFGFSKSYQLLLLLLRCSRARARGSYLFAFSIFSM